MESCNPRTYTTNHKSKEITIMSTEQNQADSNNVLAAVNPLVDIGGDTIDLRKIERVGKVGGDSSWLRYSVYFTGGSEIEIYHERKYTDNRPLRQMKREKFV
ncbi:MAG TPA: hypothetical protein DCF44_06925 [Chitinophagaceae bacterium]|nr:hypothetical protein [Chitinophagaceae bacterium]